LPYRTTLRPGGTTWIIGSAACDDAPSEWRLCRNDGAPYTIGVGFDERAHPARLLLTDVPPTFAAWLRKRAAALGVEVADVDRASVDIDPDRLRSAASGAADQKPGFSGDGTSPETWFHRASVDDIVLLRPDADLIEAVSPHLADGGIVALVADEPLGRKVQVDIGRTHYNGWLYVGGAGPDIARVYDRVPVRSRLKPGGRAWFVGAGGPMGRMHVQRAIQIAEGPSTILCTDVSTPRLDDLRATFDAEARAKGIRLVCLNPLDREVYASGMAAFEGPGFDDIIVLAPVPAVVSEAGAYLAPGGVMNIFAGVARGTSAALDLGAVYLKDVRIIGHSASTIDDLRLMLHQAESGELSPNRSVAAVGSLEAARDGLQAVMDAVYPGKIVIYPQIKDFPLTAVPDLEDRLPSVYAKLKDGREWTREAEEEFLRLMLA
jgi:hypothetical protein